MIPHRHPSQKTAEQLMAKAAIEIPEDYLGGLRQCADTEKGDLSAFVIQAMLENYEAAKEDRRAMCGDTGVPRWYVKIGNEAQIQGGPVALEAALRRATANATHDVPLRPNRVHPLWRTDHNNNCGIGAPEIEYSFHPDGRLDRPHHRAQGRPVRHRLPHAVPRRRHRRHPAVLSRHADPVRPARARLPAGHRRRGARRLQGHLDDPGQAGGLPAARSARAIPTPRSPQLEAELKELGNNIGMGAMGFMGSSMVVDCHIEVGYCHTGGMPMSVHMFCLSSRRATARVFPTAAPSSAPIPSGSPTTCAGRRWSGAGGQAQAAEWVDSVSADPTLAAD